MTRSSKAAESLTRYSLVNPHDPYEFDAPDAAVADAVALLLGGGWYSWSHFDEKGDLLAGALVAAIPDEVAQAEVTVEIAETIAGRAREVAAALRSLEIDPAGRVEAGADRDDWHNQQMSSLSDVRENAFETATALLASDG